MAPLRSAQRCARQAARAVTKLCDLMTSVDHRHLERVWQVMMRHSHFVDRDDHAGELMNAANMGKRETSARVQVREAHARRFAASVAGESQRARWLKKQDLQRRAEAALPVRPAQRRTPWRPIAPRPSRADDRNRHRGSCEFDDPVAATTTRDTGSATEATQPRQMLSNLQPSADATGRPTAQTAPVAPTAPRSQISPRSTVSQRTRWATSQHGLSRVNLPKSGSHFKIVDPDCANASRRLKAYYKARHRAVKPNQESPEPSFGLSLAMISPVKKEKVRPPGKATLSFQNPDDKRCPESIKENVEELDDHDGDETNSEQNRPQASAEEMPACGELFVGMPPNDSPAWTKQAPARAESLAEAIRRNHDRLAEERRAHSRLERLSFGDDRSYGPWSVGEPPWVP